MSLIQTGKLYDCVLVTFDESPQLQILRGTVEWHINPKYQADDWFVTSAIVEIRPDGEGSFLAITQNSVYQMVTYKSINVPWACLDNIQAGTPPEIAKKLNSGSGWRRKNITS